MPKETALRGPTETGQKAEFQLVAVHQIQHGMAAAVGSERMKSGNKPTPAPHDQQDMHRPSTRRKQLRPLATRRDARPSVATSPVQCEASPGVEQRERGAVMRTNILKIGLAAIKDGKLLVVRKRGGASFILPGGKPEASEAELDTLRREIHEELGCAVACPAFVGSFSDEAADVRSARVTVRLYSGDLCGNPAPAQEIEELAWIDMSQPTPVQLAPSLANLILPYLRSQTGQTKVRLAAG